MKAAITTGVLAMALLAGTGCHKYEDDRPPVDQLDSRDKGLQSKDIVTATDQMAASILGDEDLNKRPEQLTIVIDQMVDETNGGFKKDLFLRRLATALAKQGKGRITLVENKDRLQGMQSRELDGGVSAVPRMQADYALNGRITEMGGSKRGTSYFYTEFNISGIKGPDSGRIVWRDAYEVKVAND